MSRYRIADGGTITHRRRQPPSGTTRAGTNTEDVTLMATSYRPTPRKGGKSTPVADEWEQTAIPLEDLGHAEHRGIEVDIPQAPTRYYDRPVYPDTPTGERAKDRAKDMARDVKAGVLVRVLPPGGYPVPGDWSVWCRGGRANSWVLTPWNDAATSWAREQDVTRIDAHAWCLTPAWRA